MTLNGVTFDKDYSTLEAFVADINGTTFPNNEGPVKAQQLPFQSPPQSIYPPCHPISMWRATLWT